MVCAKKDKYKNMYFKFATLFIVIVSSIYFKYLLLLKLILLFIYLLLFTIIKLLYESHLFCMNPKIITLALDS